MRQIVFTVATSSYLGQAKTLGDSVIQHNPDTEFVIGLVDKLDVSLCPLPLPPYKIIQLEELNIPDLSEFLERYSLWEFCCNVKPFFAEHIAEKLGPEKLVYFDSDIIVLDSISGIFETLDRSSITLTPHSVEHINAVRDMNMIRVGLYNAGFFALKPDGNSLAFLRWWKEKCLNHARKDVSNGMYVDQLWLNLAPIFFEVNQERSNGQNVGMWNLHGQMISIHDGRFLINGTDPLVFFHYSGFKVIDLENDRFEYPIDRDDITPVLKLIAERNSANRSDDFKKVPNHYYSVPFKDGLPKSVRTLSSRILHSAIYRMQMMLRRIE